jgi:hypothetical protein
MGKFAKAHAEQAKLKIGIYGESGSGKTFTSLLFAEWLAAKEGKRVAFIDTERGSDFYARSIKERAVHPQAFDFDALYTRSIHEAIEAVEDLNPAEHGVLIIDSITHLWEAAKEAYAGKLTSKGGIPVQAWGEIKKPYKRLMSLFLDGDFHAIVCGREGVMMEQDADGEAKVVGKRMKSEGETPYEPHILLRFHPSREEKTGLYIISFLCEKDRSGILTGKTIQNPTFEVLEPIYGYLTPGAQGKVGSLEDAAAQDAARAEEKEEKKQAAREALYDTIRRAILAADSVDSLKAAWELMKGKKTALGAEFVEKLEATKDARKVELVEAA